MNISKSEFLKYLQVQTMRVFAQRSLTILFAVQLQNTVKLLLIYCIS